jgi:hypothetical protein
VRHRSADRFVGSMRLREFNPLARHQGDRKSLDIRPNDLLRPSDCPRFQALELLIGNHPRYFDVVGPAAQRQDGPSILRVACLGINFVCRRPIRSPGAGLGAQSTENEIADLLETRIFTAFSNDFVEPNSYGCPEWVPQP